MISKRYVREALFSCSKTTFLVAALSLFLALFGQGFSYWFFVVSLMISALALIIGLTIPPFSKGEPVIVLTDYMGRYSEEDAWDGQVVLSKIPHINLIVVCGRRIKYMVPSQFVQPKN